MVTVEQASANAAAAMSDTTIIVSGKRYIATPFRVPDYFAMRDEARRRIMGVTKDPLAVCQEKIAAAEKNKRPLPQSMIDSMIRVAMTAQKELESQSKVEPDMEQIRNETQSPGMLKWCVHRLIKPLNPSVTLDEIESALTDDAAYELTERIGEILSMRALDPNSNPPAT